MPLNGHPQLILERNGALVSVASHLHHMLMHLRAAAHYNHTHALGLVQPQRRLAELTKIYRRSA